MEQNSLKTRQEILDEFSRKGISVRKWALSRGICPSTVRGVLSGRLTGRIGESHKAAVLLGIKAGEIVDDCGNKKAA